MSHHTEAELREVQQMIAELGRDEHTELLKMIPESLVTTNKNGAFCDLTKLDSGVFDAVRSFVIFSRDNNARLEQYDKKLHYTAVMMQRHRSNDIPKSLPEFVKDVPTRNEHMAQQLAKQTPKMAFIKRSADMLERQSPMVLLSREPLCVASRREITSS